MKLEIKLDLSLNFMIFFILCRVQQVIWNVIRVLFVGRVVVELVFVNVKRLVCYYVFIGEWLLGMFYIQGVVGSGNRGRDFVFEEFGIFWGFEIRDWVVYVECFSRVLEGSVVQGVEGEVRFRMGLEFVIYSDIILVVMGRELGKIREYRGVES